MFRSTFILILFTFISICRAQNEESKILTIPQGSVRGYKSSNSEVFEFYGIPYATIPKGVDKFKVCGPVFYYYLLFFTIQYNPDLAYNVFLSYSVGEIRRYLYWLYIGNLTKFN